MRHQEQWLHALEAARLSGAVEGKTMEWEHGRCYLWRGASSITKCFHGTGWASHKHRQTLVEGIAAQLCAEPLERSSGATPGAAASVAVATVVDSTACIMPSDQATGASQVDSQQLAWCVMLHVSKPAYIQALANLPRASFKHKAPPRKHQPFSLGSGARDLRQDVGYLNYLRLGRAVMEAKHALAPLLEAVLAVDYDTIVRPAAVEALAKSFPELVDAGDLRCFDHTTQGASATKLLECDCCSVWLDTMCKRHVAGSLRDLHLENCVPGLWGHKDGHVGAWEVGKV